MQTKSQLTYYSLLSAVIIFSFLSFSAACINIHFNSDNAVHVLMTNDFRFPEDLYYWGQQRLGSIIPMLGFLFKSLGFSSIWAVSIAEYLLLILSFIFFSLTIKSLTLRFALALAWFFPLKFYFVFTQIGHPLIGQFFFLSIFYYVTYQLIFNHNKLSLFWYIAAGLAIPLSIWASELSITTFLALFFCAFRFILTQSKKALPKKLLLKNEESAILKIPSISTIVKRLNQSKYIDLIRKNAKGIAFIGISTAAGSLFLIYAKVTSTGYSYTDWSLFLSNQELLTVLETILVASFRKISFQINSPYTSLYLILLLSFSYHLIKRARNEKDYLLMFLGLNFWLTIILCTCLKWVSLNEISPRYFSGSYYWGLLYIIRLLEKNISRNKMKVFALAGINLILPLIYFLENPDILSGSHNKKLSAFQKLGKASVFGDYWDVYFAAIASDNLRVLPFQNYYIRNQHQFNDFLNNKTFYVINSKSERNFPFTLIQHGYEFKKTDNTFKLADYFISQYQLVGKMKEIVYTPLQLNSATGVVLPDSTASFKQVLCSERNNPKAGFLSYGPYINLEKGSYEVIWSLRKDANMEGNLLNLDICFKDGTEIVNFISVMDTSLQENSFTKIALELNVDDPLNKYEFRAYNTGKAPISIESIKIVKKN